MWVEQEVCADKPPGECKPISWKLVECSHMHPPISHNHKWADICEGALAVLHRQCLREQHEKLMDSAALGKTARVADRRAAGSIP